MHREDTLSMARPNPYIVVGSDVNDLWFDVLAQYKVLSKLIRQKKSRWTKLQDTLLSSDFYKIRREEALSMIQQMKEMENASSSVKESGRAQGGKQYDSTQSKRTEKKIELC